MRRCFDIFMALLLAAFQAGAQDSSNINSRSAANQSRVKRLGSATAEECSSASFLFSPFVGESSAGILWHQRHEDRPGLPQEGDGVREGEFNARSLVRLDDRSAVQGGVTYQRGVKTHVKWNATSDFGLLRPYVMGDSIGGNLQKEQYSFFGKYACRLGGKTFMGVEGGYRALHEYRTVDPRPRNIASDFTAGGSLGCLLGSCAASVSASCRKYFQTQNVSFVNPKGSNTSEFHFTGLGSHFARFSGSGIYTNTNYRGQGFSVSGLLQSVGPEGFSAGAAYAWFRTIRHLQNQNDAPITELFTRNVSAFGTWRRLVGGLALAAELAGDYELRQGDENVIDNVSTGSYLNLLSMTMYHSRQAEVSLRGAAELARPAGTWSAVPFIGFSMFSAKHLYPVRRVEHASLEAGGQCAFLHASEDWLYELEAGARWHRNLSGTFRIPLEYTEPGVAAACSEIYARFVDNFARMDLSAKLQRTVSRELAVFFRVGAHASAYSSGDREYELTTAIGIAF